MERTIVGLYMGKSFGRVSLTICRLMMYFCFKQLEMVSGEASNTPTPFHEQDWASGFQANAASAFLPRMGASLPVGRVDTLVCNWRKDRCKGLRLMVSSDHGRSGVPVCRMSPDFS